VPEQHTVTHDVVTTHSVPEQHTTTHDVVTYQSIPQTHVTTHDVVTTHEIPEVHTATHDVTTYHAIPEHHVTTSEYTTTQEIPEHHVATHDVVTTHQIAEQHTATHDVVTTHQIPEVHTATHDVVTTQQVAEQHITTSAYVTTHEVPETHMSTRTIQVPHMSYETHTATATAYKTQTYKKPYSYKVTGSVAVPDSGYRRLATAATDADAAAAKDTISTDEAQKRITAGGVKLPYGAKITSVQTHQIPKYTTYTKTHTAYKVVAKPVTVVHHLICTPVTHVSYQCPSCTHSSNYVSSYGADFLGSTYTPSQNYAAGYHTHVYHNVYHAPSVMSYNTEGELKWTPTKEGWTAEGHKDWQTQQLQQAASTETAKTVHHSSSAAGAVVGATVGCAAMAAVAMFVVKKRGVAKQALAEEDAMSIL